jgi:hypothetical protein
MGMLEVDGSLPQGSLSAFDAILVLLMHLSVLSMSKSCMLSSQRWQTMRGGTLGAVQTQKVLACV